MAEGIVLEIATSLAVTGDLPAVLETIAASFAELTTKSDALIASIAEISGSASGITKGFEEAAGGVGLISKAISELVEVAKVVGSGITAALDASFGEVATGGIAKLSEAITGLNAPMNTLESNSARITAAIAAQWGDVAAKMQAASTSNAAGAGTASGPRQRRQQTSSIPYSTADRYEADDANAVIDQRAADQRALADYENRDRIIQENNARRAEADRVRNERSAAAAAAQSYRNDQTNATAENRAYDSNAERTLDPVAIGRAADAAESSTRFNAAVESEVQRRKGFRGTLDKSNDYKTGSGPGMGALVGGVVVYDAFKSDLAEEQSKIRIAGSLGYADQIKDGKLPPELDAKIEQLILQTRAGGYVSEQKIAAALAETVRRFPPNHPGETDAEGFQRAAEMGKLAVRSAELSMQSVPGQSFESANRAYATISDTFGATDAKQAQQIYEQAYKLSEVTNLPMDQIATMIVKGVTPAKAMGMDPEKIIPAMAYFANRLGPATGGVAFENLNNAFLRAGKDSKEGRTEHLSPDLHREIASGKTISEAQQERLVERFAKGGFAGKESPLFRLGLVTEAGLPTAAAKDAQGQYDSNAVLSSLNKLEMSATTDDARIRIKQLEEQAFGIRGQRGAELASGPDFEARRAGAVEQFNKQPTMEQAQQIFFESTLGQVRQFVSLIEDLGNTLANKVNGPLSHVLSAGNSIAGSLNDAAHSDSDIVKYGVDALAGLAVVLGAWKTLSFVGKFTANQVREMMRVGQWIGEAALGAGALGAGAIGGAALLGAGGLAGKMKAPMLDDYGRPIPMFDDTGKQIGEANWGGPEGDKARRGSAIPDSASSETSSPTVPNSGLDQAAQALMHAADALVGAASVLLEGGGAVSGSGSVPLSKPSTGGAVPSTVPDYTIPPLGMSTPLSGLTQLASADPNFMPSSQSNTGPKNYSVSPNTPRPGDLDSAIPSYEPGGSESDSNSASANAIEHMSHTNEHGHLASIAGVSPESTDKAIQQQFGMAPPSSDPATRAIQEQIWKHGNQSGLNQPQIYHGIQGHHSWTHDDGVPIQQGFRHYPMEGGTPLHRSPGSMHGHGSVPIGPFHGSSSPGAGSGAPPEGWQLDDAKKLVAMGMSPQDAAGAVGNISVESAGKADAKGDGGAAYGLGQWHQDRQAKFKQMYGKDIKDSTHDEQLKFYHDEMEQRHQIPNGATAADSARSIMQHFEVPKDRATGGKNDIERGSIAESVFAGLKNQSSSQGAINPIQPGIPSLLPSVPRSDDLKLGQWGGANDPEHHAGLSPFIARAGIAFASEPSIPPQPYPGRTPPTPEQIKRGLAEKALQEHLLHGGITAADIKLRDANGPLPPKGLIDHHMKSLRGQQEMTLIDRLEQGPLTAADQEKLQPNTPTGPYNFTRPPGGPIDHHMQSLRGQQEMTMIDRFLGGKLTATDIGLIHPVDAEHHAGLSPRVPGPDKLSDPKSDAFGRYGYVYPDQSHTVHSTHHLNVDLDGDTLGSHMVESIVRGTNTANRGISGFDPLQSPSQPGPIVMRG